MDTILDPTAFGYIDIMVTQLLKNPHKVLEQLQPQQTIPDVTTVPVSNFVFFNGQPLPLPILSKGEKSELRKEIDIALKRLTKWETSEDEVPQLNLQKIKIEHDRKRQMSGENPDHSPEQDFITAREATVEECGSTRDKSLADRENAKTVTVPACQFSSSPMVRKTYRPLPPQRETIQQHHCDATIDEVSDQISNLLLVEDSSSTFEEQFSEGKEGPILSTSNSTSNGTDRSSPGQEQAETPPSCVSAPRQGAKEGVVSGVSSVTHNGGVSGVSSGAATVKGCTALIEEETAPAKEITAPSKEITAPTKENTASTKENVPSTEDNIAQTKDNIAPTKANTSAPTTFASSHSAPLLTGLTSGTASVQSCKLLNTTEKSPPSKQVLLHLEALEAAIELDMTMQSTLPTPTATSTAKRKLDLNSPPPLSPSSNHPTRPATLNLSGEPSNRRHSEGSDSPCSTPRRSISFFVEVDSPSLSSPRSPRRNTIASSRTPTLPGGGAPRTPTSATTPLFSPRTSDSIRRVCSPPPDAVTSSYKLTSPPDRRGSSPAALQPPPETTNQPLPSSSLLEPPLSSTDSGESITSGRVRNNSYSTANSKIIEARASKISALVRGFLTRALLNSYKVQQHIKTIRDTKEILSCYGAEADLSAQDLAFYNRLKDTLSQTHEKIHVIFFNTTIEERMAHIRNTRAARNELQMKELQGKLVKPGSARKKMVKKVTKQKAWI